MNEKSIFASFFLTAFAWQFIMIGCTPNEKLTAGDIVISETIRIGPESSGKTFRGAADGSTRIFGGISVTGWTDRGNGVWGAKLPNGTDGKPVYTETLFVNSRRAQRSRYPETGFFHVRGVSMGLCNESPTGNRIQIQTEPQGELAKILEATPTSELKYAQIIAHIKWDVARYPLVSYDKGSLSVDGYSIPDWAKWTNEDFYEIENLRSAFVKPGQWFCDMNAGEILYRPLEGETIKDAVIPVEGLATLVALCGVTNVVFENVTFAFSAPVPDKGPSHLLQRQAAVDASTAAVTVDHSSGIVFRNCRFEHLGGYALWFREGCRDSGAYSCEMTDLGAGGVRIGTYQWLGAGVSRRPPDCTADVPYVETAPWMTSSITVDDCLIAHGGRFHTSGVGVLLCHASDCSITHNEISDIFYTGISAGWVWGYSGSPSQRNTIAFNHIHDIGQRQLADMGGIYTLGTSFGTCISNNVVHGVHSYSYGGWGIYLDEGSEGIVVENNLVYETDDASFHQHYGKDNVLRNNILVDSSAGQIALSITELHHSFDCINNIVIWTKGDAFVNYSGTRNVNSDILWRGNTWWRTDGNESFVGKSFAEWRNAVKDDGSVFADPSFADWQSRDFTLKPDSPAVKAGFKPFDPSLAGKRHGQR